MGRFDASHAHPTAHTNFIKFDTLWSFNNENFGWSSEFPLPLSQI
jgi:hypothetical protein